MGKDGGGGSPGYYHDYTQWSEAERAFVSEEGREQLQTAYDTGYISMSPSELAAYGTVSTTTDAATDAETENAFFSLKNKVSDEASDTVYGESDTFASGLDNIADLRAKEAFNLTPESWAEYEAAFTAQQAEEAAATEAAHQQLLASRDELIAAGVPAYTLDPTPWDEVTAADEAEMAQLQVEYLAEQKRIEQEEAEAAAFAEQQAAIETDLGVMEELATLRNESESLAEADVDEYILEKTQAMKLRGITPPFTDEMREELVNARFAEYWSTTNEGQLQALVAQYGEEYGYPDISERVLGASTTSLLTTSTATTESTSAEAQAIAAAVGTSTEQTLLTEGLLEEDLEVLGASTLLGG